MTCFVRHMGFGLVTLFLVVLSWQVEPGYTADDPISRAVGEIARRKADQSSPASRLPGILRHAMQVADQQGLAAARTLMQSQMRTRGGQQLEIYVKMVDATEADLQRLEREVGQVHQLRRNGNRATALVSVPLAAVQRIADLSFVHQVTLPSYAMTRPLPAESRVGSVTSSGDTAMRAAELRANLGVDGSGVRIGIISDGLVDLQASVNSGDLPTTVEIVNGQDGNSDTNSDEGRAMAEIIHDLAPGATLLFHTGFPTSLDMAAAIEALTAAGAHIIVDDLGFLSEPIFEDGPVAQAVQDAIDAGVVYVTATGNSALENYRALYKQADSISTNSISIVNPHDFGNGDRTMTVDLPPGGSLFVVLQWADQFDGLANTADYDLIVLDAAGTSEACSGPSIQGFCVSADDQLNSTAPPIEFALVQNTASTTTTVNLVINRFAGAVRPVHMLFNTSAPIQEHNVSSQSIFGHPCVTEALAVGAIDALDPGFDTIEPFSSQGACDIYFPARETRLKPDVAGADGVNTSLPFFSPFFGTSAAAPHVAAVAALIMEAAGGPHVLTNIQVNNLLRLSATDLGDPGLDLIYGHGAVDAVEAANLLQANTNTAPESAIASPPSDLVIAPGEAPDFDGLCLDAENNGPFTFAWDFGAAGSAATVQSPGAMTFATTGSFPITFTCTDAAGLTDPTPAIRMVTVNQPPQSQITSHGESVIVAEGSGLSFTGSCSDPDQHEPFTFFWFFGDGATIDSSTQQNPGPVVFNTPGDFTVRFTCTDALGTSSLSAATVRVLVNPAANDVASAGSGGGSGGGCALQPGLARTGWPPLAAFGNILLPLLVIIVLQGWNISRRRR